MSDAWVKANSRHPDNCREYDVIFADVAGERVADLEQQLAELLELLELIRDDLRMRGEDGVVDIAHFIWMRIDRLLQEKGA